MSKARQLRDPAYRLTPISSHRDWPGQHIAGPEAQILEADANSDDGEELRPFQSTRDHGFGLDVPLNPATGSKRPGTQRDIRGPSPIPSTLGSTAASDVSLIITHVDSF